MEFDKLANMARLKIDASKRDRLEKNFQSVINKIDSDLASLGDLNIAPMSSVHEYISNMRNDDVQETNINKVFQNSDEKSRSVKCFIVPKVIS